MKTIPQKLGKKSILILKNSQKLTKMKIKEIKRICLSKSKDDNGNQFQFLTSDYPNREDDGIHFNSVDGLFMPNLIPDLEYNECDMPDQDNQGIEVVLYIHKLWFPGSKRVWCYGINKERHSPEYITPYKPENIKETKDGIKCIICGGELRLDSWNDHTYFPDTPYKFCFPVYMKVKRLKEKSIK